MSFALVKCVLQRLTKVGENEGFWRSIIADLNVTAVLLFDEGAFLAEMLIAILSIKASKSNNSHTL